MKSLYIYPFLGLIIGGIFLSPSFVVASNICYVDESVENSGDGSDDKPYKKISKATEENCSEIKLSKGTYEENVNLKAGMKLRGNSKDSTIVKGKVTMSDGSEISKVTVSIGGIEVAQGADVDIKTVIIKGANIGILTTGGGKLTADDVVISGNRKGSYIQYGKDVKITNCKVYDNKEEGLDIRANVSGSINSNEIYDNGESGIEVILGKAELSIVNNSIKKNGSSGIAAQFYSDTDKKGDVNIKNNVITDNSNYGLDCKAPSGGDGRPKGYWADSMDLTSNKIMNNKKKDISGSCKFDGDKIADATKTKEQRESEKLALEVKEKKKIISVEEKVELEEIKAQQEEENRIAQRDNEERNNINIIFDEVEKFYQDQKKNKNTIENRNKLKIFFVGEDYKKIRELRDSLYFYDQKIEEAEEKKGHIIDENILKEVDDKILALQEKRESIVKFIENQGNKFSIWGLIFKEIYLSQDDKFFGMF